MRLVQMRSVVVFDEGHTELLPLSQQLSVGIGQWLIVLMAPLVMVTHVAQLSAWPFRIYPFAARRGTLRPVFEASWFRSCFRFGKDWKPCGHSAAAGAIKGVLF